MKKRIIFKTVLSFLTITTSTAACKNGLIIPIQYCKYLLQNTQYINNKYGQTALMIAAQKGNLLLVKKLITNKTNLEAQDKEGKKAFDYAIIGYLTLLEKQPNNYAALENYIAIIKTLKPA